MLVVHYLGVDHAGHTQGAGGPAMAAKLRQLDSQIRQARANQLCRCVCGEYKRIQMQQDPAQLLLGWQPPEVFNTLFSILRVCQHAIAANCHVPCI